MHEQSFRLTSASYIRLTSGCLLENYACLDTCAFTFAYCAARPTLSDITETSCEVDASNKQCSNVRRMEQTDTKGHEQRAIKRKQQRRSTKDVQRVSSGVSDLNHLDVFLRASLHKPWVDCLSARALKLHQPKSMNAAASVRRWQEHSATSQTHSRVPPLRGKNSLLTVL